MVAALGKCGGQNKVVGIGAAVLIPLRALLAARGLLFPWVPMFLGAGIAIWFALPFEPDLGAYLALAVVFLVTLGFRLWGPELAHPLATIIGCLVAGTLAAGARARGRIWCRPRCWSFAIMAPCKAA